MVNRFGLTAMSMVNALGTTSEAVRAGLLRADRHCLTPFVLKTTQMEVAVGRVRDPLPVFPPRLGAYNCRNHCLTYGAFLQLEDAIRQTRQTYGRQRVGVVLGSSTAGLDTSEEAYRFWKNGGILPMTYNYDKQHAMGSVSRLISEAADLKGPTYTISTACSSSAKVFASARALLECGICDAVVAGGVDTLCHTTLNGFEALGTLTRTRCLPMSRNRSGFHIGEGAALFILTREPAAINLLGIGESCDAYHMSSPHPEGVGAETAMRMALDDAGLAQQDIAYINLHGTGTPQNDLMEAKAVSRIFDRTPCSSTKPLVGHCLGAAGAMEVGFCWLALEAADSDGCDLPPHSWDEQPDPEIEPLVLVKRGDRLPMSPQIAMMSNSFAFGGNNCSVIIAREH